MNLLAQEIYFSEAFKREQACRSPGKIKGESSYLAAHILTDVDSVVCEIFIKDSDPKVTE
jgi:hypothetical protein